jgi:beta-lactamase regulating signal transducer with metallopeptidase domain
LRNLLPFVWYAGIGGVGLCLIFSNLSFGRKLRKTRKAIEADGGRLPVYVVDALPSPCLFGVFRPAIYLTPEVAKDETKLRHVLAHELTHYRHGDHIWSALRGLCLAVHWYNPLVWLAASLSRRDSELACDEGTVKSIGEQGRMDYGRTLIGLTCENEAPWISCASPPPCGTGKRASGSALRCLPKSRKFSCRRFLRSCSSRLSRWAAPSRSGNGGGSRPAHSGRAGAV